MGIFFICVHNIASNLKNSSVYFAHGSQINFLQKARTGIMSSLKKSNPINTLGQLQRTANGSSMEETETAS